MTSSQDPGLDPKKQAFIEAVRQLARKHNVAHLTQTREYLRALQQSAFTTRNAVLFKDNILSLATKTLGIPREELEPIFTMLFEG